MSSWGSYVGDEYTSPDHFKIGSIILPTWKGHSPMEVIGWSGAFVKCKRLSFDNDEVLYLFPSEIGEVLKLETRENLINKIIS